MTTPRVRVAALCEEFGREIVVERCCRLLAGGDESPGFVDALAGVPWAAPLLGPDARPDQRYWLRVFGARGLLWAGPPASPDVRAVDVLRAALTDDAWRVREMTCKVVARHRVGDLLDAVAALESDPIARVRSAASRAVREIIATDA